MKALVVYAALLGSLLLPQLAVAQFTPGARTLEDPMFPTLGNGGYDVQHYDLTIHFDPASKAMVSNADKLIITPAAGIEQGRVLHAVVHYSGQPSAILLYGEIITGWVAMDQLQ